MPGIEFAFRLYGNATEPGSVQLHGCYLRESHESRHNLYNPVTQIPHKFLCLCVPYLRVSKRRGVNRFEAAWRCICTSQIPRPWLPQLLCSLPRIAREIEIVPGCLEQCHPMLDSAPAPLALWPRSWSSRCSSVVSMGPAGSKTDGI